MIGPLVEIRRDEVRGGTDELDSAGMRLVVRASALEARQERVVDVDDLAGQPGAQVVAEHLHVPGQHHDVDRCSSTSSSSLLLLLPLGLGGDGQVRERDAVSLGDGAAVLVVGDHERDLDGQLADVEAVEQVDEAVILARDHDQRPAPLTLRAQPDDRIEDPSAREHRVAHRLNRLLGRLEPGAHGEQAGVLVGELRLLEDVGADLQECAGDGVDDPGSVQAAQGQEVRLHRSIVSHDPSVAPPGTRRAWS